MGKESQFNWDKISRLYDQVTNLPKSDRKAFLSELPEEKEIKQELISLLELEKPSTEYFDTLTQKLIEPALDELSDLPPYSGIVKNYRLIDKLGRGGMGTVYMAERDDNLFNNRVAVKILRRGMDTEDILNRFRNERQILARLNHPNITHLLDGGITSDGRPYFVMEYVEGIPITQYCDKKKLSPLQRLHLFIQICDALEYAHQNLVIHRYLKPENILVTPQGNVKLLDFGIAKLLDPKHSRPYTLPGKGNNIMTPEYASPEQICGKPMNTSSDIYQLGLVLYSLLSGHSPQKTEGYSLKEAERIILDKIPEKPSQIILKLSPEKLFDICENRSISPARLKSFLKGDIDTIILRAVKKNPKERFSTVMELKGDILRFNKGEPIISRGENVGYKLIKFTRRNLIPIFFATLFLTTLLLFGAFHHFSIAEQRNHAQQEAAKAAHVTAFMMDLFEANDPALSQGDELTARELLEKAETRIALLEGQPEIQAEMFDVTGQIYRRLGLFDRSEELLNNSLELRIELYGSDHPETMTAFDQIGLLYSDMGHFEAADSLHRKVLMSRENTLASNDPAIAESYSNLAYVVRRTGNISEAENMYRKSFEIRQKTLGAEHPLTIESLSSLGVTLLNKARYIESEAILSDVLYRRRGYLGSHHPDLAMSINNLGAVSLNLGNFSNAEQLFEESYEMRKSLFGEMHPKVALVRNNLGIAQLEQKNYEMASYHFKSALQIRKEILGDHNVATAISRFCLGDLYWQMNRYDDAYYMLSKAYEVFKSQLSPAHSFAARTQMLLGLTHLGLSNYDAAYEFMSNGFEKVKEVHNENSLEMAIARWHYGIYLSKTGEHNSAAESLQASLQILQLLENGSTARQEKIRIYIEQNRQISSDL